MRARADIEIREFIAVLQLQQSKANATEWLFLSRVPSDAQGAHTSPLEWKQKPPCMGPETPHKRENRSKHRKLACRWGSRGSYSNLKGAKRKGGLEVSRVAGPHTWYSVLGALRLRTRHTPCWRLSAPHTLYSILVPINSRHFVLHAGAFRLHTQSTPCWSFPAPNTSYSMLAPCGSAHAVLSAGAFQPLTPNTPCWSLSAPHTQYSVLVPSSPWHQILHAGALRLRTRSTQC